MRDIRLDRVFIGSCTNSRIGDLRAAAAVVEGRRVASHVDAMVVPGSVQVKRQAEAEGLDEVFRAAGFDWRGAGCSMCLGMNPDIAAPGERCAARRTATSRGARAAAAARHLVSPQMAAAAAIEGHFVDIREWSAVEGTAHESHRDHHRPRRGPGPRRRRHGPDHPQAVPQARGAHGLRPVPLLRLGPGARLGPARPTRSSSTGRELRLRLQPRARALGARGLRLPRDHRPSFADIFSSNCTKIGLLPIVLAPDEVQARGRRRAAPRSTSPPRRSAGPTASAVARFEIDPEVKHRLLNGLDDIALTLQRDDEIAAYERDRERCGPGHDGRGDRSRAATIVTAARGRDRAGDRGRRPSTSCGARRRRRRRSRSTPSAALDRPPRHRADRRGRSPPAVRPTPCCWPPWAARGGTRPTPTPRARAGPARPAHASSGCTPTCARSRPSTRCWTPARCAASVIEGTDLLVVRELTGGIYFGEKTRTDRRARRDDCALHARRDRADRPRRLPRRPLEGRQRRQGQRAGDAAGCGARSSATSTPREFPHIELEHVLVDNAAMQLVTAPRHFDVIVTENMFGDILSDEAAMHHRLDRHAAQRVARGATARRACSSPCTARRRTSPGRGSPTRWRCSCRRRCCCATASASTRAAAAVESAVDRALRGGPAHARPRRDGDAPPRRPQAVLADL